MTEAHEATMLWSNDDIRRFVDEHYDKYGTRWACMHAGMRQVRDDMQQALAEREMPDEVRAIIVRVLEDECDRHIMSGGLAANRKELNAALRWLLAQKEGDDE